MIPSPARSEEGELTNEGNMTLNEPSMNDNGDHLGEEEGISTPLPDQDENVTDETTTGSDEDFVESTQDTSSMMLSYSQDWVASLLRDDQKSLSILLHSLLVDKLQIQKSVASETVGQIIGVSERTVREWRSVFTENDGCFPDSLQGKYVQEDVLWLNEELNEKASNYVRENASVKGQPNLTIMMFRHWVNNCLLPSSDLRDSFPKSIGYETARVWMHELGFRVINKKKGIFIDGHERPDVVEYRRKFIRRMIACGMLAKEHAPMDDERQLFPDDIDSPSSEQRLNNIVLFHDESIFNSNEDESVQWGIKDQHFVRPKSKGAGIMVADFIEEQGGYLQLTTEQFEEAKKANPAIRRSSRVLLEYGESHDGYFTSEKFLIQVESAIQIAEYKYPRSQGYRLYFIFDQSSCHTAYGEDALHVDRMNVKPGG